MLILGIAAYLVVGAIVLYYLIATRGPAGSDEYAFVFFLWPIVPLLLLGSKFVDHAEETWRRRS